MIALTACGHTIGGVRDADFPTLVSAGTDPTKPHIVDFDSTTQYDNKVYVYFLVSLWLSLTLFFSVTEFLDGTTQNVLVVTPNTTMASDLRVFTSDGNQTMRG